MAVIIGESGALREVMRKIAQAGLQAATLDEVRRLPGVLAARRKTAEEGARAELIKREAEIKANLVQVEEQVKTTLERELPQYHARIAADEVARGRAAQEARDSGTLLGNLLRPTRLPRWLRANLALRKATKVLQLHVAEADRFKIQTEAKLLPWRGLLQAHEANRDMLIRAGVQMLDRQIGCVALLLEGGEVAGADAELEVIEFLRQLPDDWHVVNDISVQSARWIHFDGQHLKSAQIDHLVIGPGGIFILETKNWSRAFTEAGQFHNPFSQVSRASYLCYRLLKEAGIPLKTRAVIVTRAKLPEKPMDSYAKVVRPEDLCRYLMRCEARLPSAEAVRLVAFFTQRSMH